MSAFDSFARQMASDAMMFDVDVHPVHGVRVSPRSFMCVVCSAPSGHPDQPRQFGVFGVDGDFFCSMDCHDQHQCQRANVVWDGSQWQACRGVHGNMQVRCPDCDFRRNQQGDENA